jgi:hypothetical protein
MHRCPHCGESLPLVADAYCSACGGDLGEPPAQPSTPAEQTQGHRQSKFVLWQVLGGVVALGGLSFLVRGQVYDGLPMLVIGIISFAEATRRAMRAP